MKENVLQKEYSTPYFLLLIFLSAILFFPSLGKMPLWIYDEVRNAECAREMWERNDVVVPTFNGELRALKPVLHYYFMWAGYDIFGLNEWGARFFSAVFGLLTIMLTYFYVAKYSTRFKAFICCCVLLASTHFLFEFRMSVPDPYLIFLNTLSLFAFYQYFKERTLSPLIIGSIAFGLGILAKGPVALALPGLSILVWLIWERDWKKIFHPHILLAAVIVLAVALPWYIAVHYATDGAWTRGFFIDNNLGRFSEPMEGHGGLFIIVPLFILLGLLPYSIFIGESVKEFKSQLNHSFFKLAFVVMLVFTVFYSISGTKLPNYPMPCYPFVAIVLGNFISDAYQNKIKSRLYPFIILLIINIVIPIGLYLGIKNEVELKGLENEAFITIMLPIAAITSLFLYRKKGFKMAVTALMIFYTLFNLVFFNYLYPAIYINNPLSKTINEVKKYDTVIGYKIFHPSFTFYLKDRVKVFDDRDSLALFLKGNKALILSRLNLTNELDSLHLKTVAAHHDLFESHTTVLMTNSDQ